MGQALVLRRDLLPESYILALQRLQDHVVGFSPALARAEVERAAGQPLKALFQEFEDSPLAAASVAQVHRATCTSSSRSACSTPIPMAATCSTRPVGASACTTSAWSVS